MISSMTGYGKGILQEGGLLIEVEIRSLNSRFLEISVKLPRGLSNKEFDIREKIKKSVRRGKLGLTIHIRREEAGGKYGFIDSEGLKDVINFLLELKNTAKIKDKITLDNLLTFQHLFFTDNAKNLEGEFELIEKAINLALEDLYNMRRKEGETLAKDLSERLNNIEVTVKRIEDADTVSVQEYFDKLKERAKQLFNELGEYDERLNMELALLAERYDVTEECVRLKSHLKIFRDTMNNSDEAGRKLNFISQEMNREANTINSKSLSSEISHQGILIKEELEKIREQIQNIE